MSKRLYIWMLVLSVLTVLWCIVLYDMTDAIFSDMELYGIKHGDEAYNHMVTVAQRQIQYISIPLALLHIATVVGWGYCLTSDKHQTPTPGTPQREEILKHSDK